MKKILTLVVFALMIHNGRGQSLQQMLDFFHPEEAAIFAPGLISDGLNNRDFVIAPDGNEIFYTIQSTRFVKSVIIHRKKVDGSWQPPQIASFSGTYRDLEASFSPDGKSLYFSSDRPSGPIDHSTDFDIWRVDRAGDDWGKPVRLGDTVNSAKNEFFPSVTRNGTIYFTAESVRDNGGEDIVKCRMEKGAFLPREVLNDNVNSTGDDFNAYVDPDEQFIIFTSYHGREDELGGGDLYIARRDEKNGWKRATNMGPRINSSSLDYCPFVSTDRKTLYFSSKRDQPYHIPGNYDELMAMLGGAGNGLDDIYAVGFPVLTIRIR